MSEFEFCSFFLLHSLNVSFPLVWFTLATNVEGSVSSYEIIVVKCVFSAVYRQNKLSVACCGSCNLSRFLINVSFWHFLNCLVSDSEEDL